MFSKITSRTPIINLTSDLLEMITTQTRARLVADGLACPANIDNALASARGGKRYIKIMVGNSVRYFVRFSDGMIFASASRSAPNFNRSFGTVFTIADFEWGAYEAVAKPNTRWEMKPTRGGYHTAVALY